MKGIVSEDWIRMLQEEKFSATIRRPRNYSDTGKGLDKKTVNVQNTELC